jgi:hypothetical protein
MTNDRLKSFRTGFVNIAKIFYERHNGIVNFYPVYVDKENNRIVISKNISFNPFNSFHEEKRRIVSCVFQEILRLIYENKN